MTYMPNAAADVNCFAPFFRGPIENLDPERLPGETWVQAREAQVKAFGASGGRMPYQDHSRFSGPSRRVEGPASPTVLRKRIADFLPPRPLCTDDPSLGVYALPRSAAIHRELIQLNGPQVITFVTFDLDRPDAIHAARKANLPAPSIFADGGENGHGHATYALQTPVGRFAYSREKPLDYLAAIENAYTHRFGADQNYNGPLTKNPLSGIWRVKWGRPYTLSELASALSPAELKRQRVERKYERGLSRNCDAFEDTRAWAYQNVMAFKHAGGTEAQWIARLAEIVAGHNRAFAAPLTCGECRAIAKSVGKWTWARFTDAAFSAIQSRRAQRRWSAHVAVSQTKPWEAKGISERTWYRRKAANRNV